MKISERRDEEQKTRQSLRSHFESPGNDGVAAQCHNLDEEFVDSSTGEVSSSICFDGMP